MTTLAQSAINLVVQFVGIISKILVPHLRNRFLSFLDNLGVKSPKTMYNNKELAPRIKRYITEYIYNLIKVLADLERAGVTIVRNKSQFCQAGRKIVGFICDANGCHFNTSKILKILDWPEYTDVTSAYAFMGILFTTKFRSKTLIRLHPLFITCSKNIYTIYMG